MKEWNSWKNSEIEFLRNNFKEMRVAEKNPVLMEILKLLKER